MDPLAFIRSLPPLTVQQPLVTPIPGRMQPTPLVAPVLQPAPFAPMPPLPGRTPPQPIFAPIPPLQQQVTIPPIFVPAPMPPLPGRIPLVPMTPLVAPQRVPLVPVTPLVPPTFPAPQLPATVPQIPLPEGPVIIRPPRPVTPPPGPALITAAPITAQPIPLAPAKKVAPAKKARPVPGPPKHTTKYLTKYERARVLGTRAMQLEQGAPPMVDLLPGDEPLTIAKRELHHKPRPLMPLTVYRHVPGGEDEEIPVSMLIVDQ